MRKLTTLKIAALCLGGGLLPLAGQAADPATPSLTKQDSAPVQSTWKPQEIRYSYTGFTTAYNCDAAEMRVRSILLALGAHPQTKVQALGCDFNRPSRNFFITISTATPVPVADKPAAAKPDGREELLRRMGVRNNDFDQVFPAQWKTVQLSRDRKLDLQPGDCELMEGLRDQVLPKLSIKVVSDRVQCIPRQLTIQTPELTVSALVPLPTADKPKT
jgi:hypothetical protein